MIAPRRKSRDRPLMARTNRGDRQGSSFRPGRFTGRDRARHRSLDEGIGPRARRLDRARRGRALKPTEGWRLLVELCGRVRGLPCYPVYV